MKSNKILNHLKRASVIAENSPDETTKVGCIIVNEYCDTLATGYNGFIRGAKDEKLPQTRPEKYNFFIHAEANAILQAAARGTALRNSICFCTLSPCSACMRMLWQVGIKEIYFVEKYRDFDKQVNMQDLNLILTNFEKYYRLKLLAK